MLKERNIQEEWVWRIIDSPDKTETGKDVNTHYYKAISEMKSRILHPAPIVRLCGDGRCVFRLSSFALTIGAGFHQKDL